MKNSFVVRFGIGLWLTAMGITGFWAVPLAWIAAQVLGSMLDKGIVVIDLSIDSLRQAIDDTRWRAEALKAYDHARSRVFTEKEKDAIRKEYLDTLDRYVSISQLSNNNNP